KLNENVSKLSGKRVETRSQASSSSLQLTLENKDLEAVKKQYLDKLERILDGKTDVIGFLYSINGEINSAEIYNNKSLFRALWPKLLDAAVTEAITEHRAGRLSQAIDPSALQMFFESGLSGSVTERAVGKSTRARTYTTAATLL